MNLLCADEPAIIGVNQQANKLKVFPKESFHLGRCLGRANNQAGPIALRQVKKQRRRFWQFTLTFKLIERGTVAVCPHIMVLHLVMSKKMPLGNQIFNFVNFCESCFYARERAGKLF
jgi:hypothetical protein